MIWLLVPLVTLFGMWGGQKMKWVRRIGIPSVSTFFVLATNPKRKAKEKVKYLWLWLLALILSMGYGENSKIKRLVKYEWATRFVYSLLLCVPFIILKQYYAPLLMIPAFQYRSGWLGLNTFKIGQYDWLWEDFFRYSMLGICLALTIGG